jgi:hypothetical protein
VSIERTLSASNLHQQNGVQGPDSRVQEAVDLDTPCLDDHFIIYLTLWYLRYSVVISDDSNVLETMLCGPATNRDMVAIPNVTLLQRVNLHSTSGFVLADNNVAQ